MHGLRAPWDAGESEACDAQFPAVRYELTSRWPNLAIECFDFNPRPRAVSNGRVEPHVEELEDWLTAHPGVWFTVGFSTGGLVLYEWLATDGPRESLAGAVAIGAPIRGWAYEVHLPTHPDHTLNIPAKGDGPRWEISSGQIPRGLGRSRLDVIYSRADKTVPPLDAGMAEPGKPTVFQPLHPSISLHPFNHHSHNDMCVSRQVASIVAEAYGRARSFSP